MKIRLKKLAELFLVFMKIGAFTFGGGYAMIPLIQRETAYKRKYVSEEEILEIIAVSESTPGPIAVNSATFIGRRVAGIAGGAAATAGVVLPSFLIILTIALFSASFMNIKAVEYAFVGIRAGVAALIMRACFTLFKSCKKDAAAYIIMAAAFCAMVIFKISAPLIVAAAALIGLAVYLLAERAQK